MEVTQSKTVPVTKQMVWLAYKKVRTKGKAAGVDDQSMKDFEVNLKGNLYKIWNRLSSGSYFPPAVREVEIPKKDGKMRKLGIPTIGDRIAQMVVKDYLEAKIDGLFHNNSYGYRPLKSAHDALQQARVNTREYDWVIDLDIKGFFDTIDHELLMKALEKVEKEKWVKMYCKRWLEMPVQKLDGTIEAKQGKGTPQGGVISPLLANLFLHYAFDKWITKLYPKNSFERYADDIIIHCKIQEQAREILARIEERMTQCKLQLHPLKTKLVYCKDYRRKEAFEQVQFDFLGYSFQPPSTRSKKAKEIFLGFDLAISKSSRKKIVEEINSFRIHRWSSCEIEDIAKLLNPKLRGWINYYGKFRKGELLQVFRRLNTRLMKWVMNRYKLNKSSTRKAYELLRKFYKTNNNLFAHWEAGCPA